VTKTTSGLAGLVDHLRTHALITEGRFTLRSGIVSDWYLDGRRTTLDGEGAVLVGRAVLEVLDPATEAVGGMTMGADPIAVATAVVAQLEGHRRLSAFSVRKEAKGHGIGGRLVGPVAKGDRATVVEDTATTGGALCEAVEVLLDAGVSVLQAVAVVDRSGGAAAERLAALSVPYLWLVSPADLGVGG
jgi:orotate phosphoribosyltransferase